jgi:hypothetical protein
LESIPGLLKSLKVPPHEKEAEERGKDRESRGHILSPLLEDKVNSGMGLSKLDSGIGLPMINVLESTLESA